MGVKITEDHAPLGPAELANLLTIVTDDELVDRRRTSLKVISIEDVIAEQVASSRAHRVPSALATTRIQVLVALARRGSAGHSGLVISNAAWPTTREVRSPSRQRGRGGDGIRHSAARDGAQQYASGGQHLVRHERL